MKKQTLWLILAVSLAACAQSGDAGTTTGGTTTSQTCRKYPTSMTDTTATINYTCTFNGSTTVTCTNGGAESITYTYPSLQAFVDEAATPVSVFNRRRLSSMAIVSANASFQQTLNFNYNASNQVTSIGVTGGTYTATYTFTAWDANNRHTTGTFAFNTGGVCTGRSFTSSYDDTTRTQTNNATGGTGANCAAVAPANDVQDADGIATASSLGRSYTINSKGTACY